MPDTIRVQTDRSLFLGAQVIQKGDRLLLRVFGGWIEGIVQQGNTGWYLLTAAQVGIRLRAGLVASFGEVPGGSYP